MLLPLLLSITSSWQPTSSTGMSACLSISQHQHHSNCALPSLTWISQRSVDVARSYSCSLIHANPLLLLTYLQICAPSCLTSAPPTPLPILSLADSVIHEWYIGGYSLSGPDARRLFSDLSLPKQWPRLNTQLFSFPHPPPPLTLSMPYSTLYQIVIRFALCGEHLTQESKYTPSQAGTFCAVLPIRLCSACICSLPLLVHL